MSFPAPTGLVGNNPLGLSVALTWAPVSVPDPNVSLLLHCDGTNGSTVFPDSSGVGNVVTANGTAAVTTTNPEFGTGCLNKPVGANYLSTLVAPGPLDLTTGDFMVELSVLVNSYNSFGGAGLMEASYSFGNGWALDLESQSSTGNLVARFGSSTLPNNLTAGVPLNTWTRLAFARQGNIFGVWQDGVNGGTITAAGSLGAIATLLKIGNSPTANDASNIQIDEIRITKGLARVTPGTNYTPAAGPFSAAISPVGYDVYRNGVSVGTVTGVTAFIDATVPGPGTYSYTVACWDGSMDVSPQSSPAVPVVVIGGGGGGGGGPGAPGGGGLINWVGNTGTLTAKFVPPTISKAIMLANPGAINPRAYVSEEDTTARLPLPRLPL